MQERGNIVRWIIGCLILTAILWGIIYYGPEIWESLQKKAHGYLSVRDVVEHPNEYLGDEITVRGILFARILIETKPETQQVWGLTLRNLPTDIELIEGGTYEATGILHYENLIYLDVETIKPV